MEEWKPIVCYEEKYQISNYGQVKSLNYRGSGKDKILKLQKDTYGYNKVILYKNGKAKTRTVHRLVAEAFVPNPNNLPQINHKDEDKSNNCVDNLEWCSAKYNNSYGSRKERVSMLQGKKVRCVELDKVFGSFTEAARELGLEGINISRCCRNIKGYKTAGGYHWEFPEQTKIVG
jgi:hypothetical protein